MQTLTADQLDAFVREAKASGVFELYYLELATGLRRGELLGLHWEDIDLEQQTITVRRQVVRVNGQVVEACLLYTSHPKGSQQRNNNRENAIRWGSSLRVKDGEVAVFVYKQKDGEVQDFIVGPFLSLIHILNYFINTAFPTEQETSRIVELISKFDGVGQGRLISELNIRKSRIDKALAFLQNDGFIRKEQSKYYITPKRFVYEGERYDAIREIRKKEMKQMEELTQTKECLSRLIVSCLDDPQANDCGHCANCMGHNLFPTDVSPQTIHKAEAYLNKLVIPIEPRKQWASSRVTRQTKIEFINEPGI